MELIKKTEIDNKLDKAKNRVATIKQFHKHLLVYIGVNGFVTFSKVVRNLDNGETFMEAFWDFGTLVIWLFWGIGLMVHGLKVFVYEGSFAKRWEQQQLLRYMREDEETLRKYK